MWHASGTTGEASGSDLPASATARVHGEARPRRSPASLASARRARGSFRLDFTCVARSSHSTALARAVEAVTPNTDERAVMTLKRRGPLVERISFGIVRVYLEDIQEIFSILQEVAKSVRIQADDFVATEPRDLLDISSETISDMSIVAVEPSVTVTLSKNTATMEATDADMATLGALKRIEELMRRRRRPFKRWVWNPGPNPLSPVVAVFLALIPVVLLLVGALSSDTTPANPATTSSLPTTSPLSPASEENTELSLGWAIGISSLILLAIVLSIILTAQRRALVIPRTQKDAPPFWERNRDQIMINAIFAVIGGVLGIIGTLLVQVLFDTK